MAYTKNDVIKLAIDAIQNRVAGNFSAADTSETLRQALIEINGGSAKFDRKAFRRNKVDIFEIIEVLVPRIINEGLKGDEFFTKFVDQRNLALGDENEFWADDNTTFVVSEIADGVATPRRQRIGEKTKVTVSTSKHAIRMYDEWSRFMAGRLDWNELVDKIAKAFTNAIYNDIYTTFSGISAATTGLSATYVITGSFSAESLAAIIDHVEAATGKTAYITGTKPALRKVAGSQISDTAKEEFYQNGFYGTFYGTPMIAIKNLHTVGTDSFLFPDNVVYVFAGDEQFIKFVQVGEDYMVETTSEKNRDMSQEYLYMSEWGVSLMITGKMGKYTISA